MLHDIDSPHDIESPHDMEFLKSVPDILIVLLRVPCVVEGLDSF